MRYRGLIYGALISSTVVVGLSSYHAFRAALNIMGVGFRFLDKPRPYSDDVEFILKNSAEQFVFSSTSAVMGLFAIVMLLIYLKKNKAITSHSSMPEKSSGGTRDFPQIDGHSRLT